MTPALSDEALTELRRRLCRAVSRICPAWLSAQADDIVQSALLKTLDATGNREGIPEFASLYVEKAAFSAVVDEIRRQRRRREDPGGETRLAGAAGPRSADPETLAASKEIAAGIRDCLALLDRPRRLAVTLHLQGHSIPETGALLECPAKRAENHVYRGLADLRRCLTGKGLAR